MASVRIAEHLVILTDHSEGLLNRAYNIIRFEAIKFPDPDLDRFIKKLGDLYPKSAEKLSKEKGHDQFNARATEIYNSYKDYYYTFADVIHFNEKTMNIFREISTTLHPLDIDVNTELYRLFFTLFTNWGKINYMMSRVYETCKPILYSYARAHHLVTGNTENKFHEISVYVLETLHKPFEKLRGLLDPHSSETTLPSLSPYIGSSLIRLSMTLSTYKTHVPMMSKGLFSVLEKSDDMLLPKHEDTHALLTLLPNIREWAIWGYLLCPAELHGEAHINILVAALSDVLMLQVHRDEILNIHEEIDRLFSDYQIKSLKFKLSRHRQPTRDLHNAYDSVAQRHMAYRRYLSVELELLYKFIRTSVSGNTLAPKLTMALTLLKLTQDEVIWYYVNRDQRPYKASSRFNISFDPVIAEMIHYSLLIRDIILKHTNNYVDGEKPCSVAAIDPTVPQAPKVQSSVQIYYTELLTHHSRQVHSRKQSLSSTIAIVEPTSGILELITKTLDSVEDNIGTDGFAQMTYESLRLNITRALALLSSKQTFNSIAGANSRLQSELSKVYRHSMYVDHIEGLLFDRDICSYKDLLWFSNYLCQDVTRLTIGITLPAPVDRNTPPPQPSKHSKYAVAYARIMGNALLNLHKTCPEEMNAITVAASRTTDEILNIITRNACDGIHKLSRFYLSLRKYVNITALNLKAPQKIFPGVDSDLYDNTAVILNQIQQSNESGKPLTENEQQQILQTNMLGLRTTHRHRQHQQHLFGLIAAMCRIVSIRIHTYDISPREFMVSALQAQIRLMVRSQVVPSLTSVSNNETHQEVDEILNTADPDHTIQKNVDNFKKLITDVDQRNYNEPTHNIKRPSLLYVAILNILYLCHDLDRECNLGCGEMCRLILNTEFTGVYSRCGGEHNGHVSFDATKAEDGAALKTPILTYICNWYVNLFSRDFESLRITHNEMLGMYECRPVVHVSGGKLRNITFNPHLFTDPMELRALVSLCGPRGVELFSKYLLVIVQKFTKKLFDVISKNSTLLLSVRNRFTDPQVWLSICEQLQEKEELLQYAAVIGNALEFRSMLRRCLRTLMYENSPLLADILAQSSTVAQTFINDHMFDSRVLAVQDIADSAAVNHEQSICDDHHLREVLRRFKTSPQDHQVWSLLPEMFCLAFISMTHQTANTGLSLGSSRTVDSFVARSKYLTSSEGYNNNLHLVVRTVRDLIGVFIALPINTKTTVDAYGQIQAELRRFLKVCAFCLVNLTSLHNKQPKPELLVLLEKFVDSCQGYLSMNELESFIPYSAMRSHYIRFLDLSSGGDDRVTTDE